MLLDLYFFFLLMCTNIFPKFVYIFFWTAHLWCKMANSWCVTSYWHKLFQMTFSLAYSFFLANFSCYDSVRHTVHSTLLPRNEKVTAVNSHPLYLRLLKSLISYFIEKFDEFSALYFPWWRIWVLNVGSSCSSCWCWWIFILHYDVDLTLMVSVN